jgi:hypothetical protein
MYLELDPMATLHMPKFSQDLGNGCVLLRPSDQLPTAILGVGGNVISWALHTSKVRRWGRQSLPNGQIVRSAWCEGKQASSSKVWVTQNVKVCPITV